MNDLIPNRADELVEKFISMFPDLQKGDFSLPMSYHNTLNEVAESLLQSPNKELEALAVNKGDELFQDYVADHNTKDLSEQDLQKFYLKYIDFIVDIKRKLIIRDTAYRQIFMLKPSFSPSVDAYEEIGFNKLDISPRLSSYAIVS